MELQKSQTQGKKLETLILDIKVPNEQRIVYHGYLDQVRQGAYELFIDIYNKLRGTK